MSDYLKVLLLDCKTSFSKILRYKIGDFFGPVDLGLHLSGKYNSLNIGAGLLAGSILPGSNRLIFTGFSPCWGGFFISSMGGAGLVFDNLGINMISLIGKTSVPSILYLNRPHGEDIHIDILPVDINKIWKQGEGGIFSLSDYTLNIFQDKYENDPRILATGPASEATDFGAIASFPVNRGKLSSVDTWAGRGGFGSRMFREHGICSIIYGGTFIDDDFRDRNVADGWFSAKYQKKMTAKDFEATSKYRFEPAFDTGGTFGVNFTTIGSRLLFFNYKSIYMEEEERLSVYNKLIRNHYLKQFNEETIKTKQYYNCGEPCVAVCKKLNGKYKKDYEPYQTMGPLTGIFDQRAAEKLNNHANMYGFDAISAGGILGWLMECLSDKLLTPEELGVSEYPVFSSIDFKAVTDSMHNAETGMALLDSIIEKRGVLNLEEGPRKLARRLSREKGQKILDAFIFNGFGRKGWIVPNQYWTPGVLSPMAMMGKYYMHYANDYLSPRELGRKNASRMISELTMDNLGFCRFHRLWAEDMLPDIMETLYRLKDAYKKNILMTSARINSRNVSVFWESERNIDFIHTFLKRRRDTEGDNNPDLLKWIVEFEKDKKEAALNFWYEIHKGISESLREF